MAARGDVGVHVEMCTWGVCTWRGVYLKVCEVERSGGSADRGGGGGGGVGRA